MQDIVETVDIRPDLVEAARRAYPAYRLERQASELVCWGYRDWPVRSVAIGSFRGWWWCYAPNPSHRNRMDFATETEAIDFLVRWLNTIADVGRRVTAAEAEKMWRDGR